MFLVHVSAHRSAVELRPVSPNTDLTAGEHISILAHGSTADRCKELKHEEERFIQQGQSRLLGD